MAGTNFKTGVRSRGIPAEGLDLMPFLGPEGSAAGASGNVYFVDANATGASDNHAGTDPGKPLASLAGAETLVVANRGDVVIVGAGHTETWATLAASPTLAKAGVRWVFQRVGAKVATFTVGSSANTDATLTISAASLKFGDIENMPIFIPGVDSVVVPVTISGANVSAFYEVRDTSALIEFVRHAVTVAAADNLRLHVKHRGFIAGDACVNSIRLVGADGARITYDFFGKASTAIVEFITTLSSDVVIYGVGHNSGTTDGSKNVVNTGGLSCTWYANIEDSGAGKSYSGGSASALASDDVSAVSADLATLQAEVSGAAGLVTFPAGAAAANAVSLAEVLRYLQENVILGAGTVLPTGASLWGALAGASGIPTYPAAAAPANDVSLAEVLRDAWDALRNGTGGSEPGANKSVVDAIGFDGVAAVAASAGMLRVAAGSTFIMKKTLTSSAVLAAGVDVTAISTVGDILIEDFILQTDGTGLATGTNFTLETNNAKGLAVFASHAVASLGAQALIDKKTATVGKGTVLETGKKIVAKCTALDCTGAGTIDVYLLCRRLADNATLAAA